MFSKQPFIRKSVNKIKVGIKVNIFKEGDSYIAYCQELELSSYGDTPEIAKKRFDKEVKIFFEETYKRGTLEKLLLKLGWRLTKIP